MFRHLGAKRNFVHNLRLAILLCFTAGFVNAAGFLAFSTLTTNVTGHAALLAVKFAETDFRALIVVFIWLLLFLMGAFFSSFYINAVGRNKVYAYTLPMVIEIFIFLAIVFWGHYYDHTLIKREFFPGSLLFAMGMQNAMVSMVSGSVVRTTHLTGIFTDLGIDLSTFMHPNKQPRGEVRKRIFLRLMIILFFLGGGISGGIMFHQMKYKAFLIPSGVLIITIFYDYFRVHWSRLWRRSLKSPRR